MTLPEVTVIRPRLPWYAVGLSSLWRYRELLYFLVMREIRVRYKQAALGAGWALAQPVLTAAVFTIVFGMFARVPSDGVPYAVFALCGLVPWTLFSESFRRSTVGLIGDAELIKKIYFPRVIVPLANVAVPFVDFVVALPVTLAVASFFGFQPSWHIVALPLIGAQAAALGLAFGLLLGPVNVRYRDVMHALPLVLQLALYLSPALYSRSMVPESWLRLYDLNPMVSVLASFRWAVLGSGSVDSALLLQSIAVTIVLLVIGFVTFSRTAHNVVDSI